jgi:hypothetical protein
MVDFYPNYLDVLSHKPLTYLLRSGLLAQFGHPSMDDSPNCESSEF